MIDNYRKTKIVCTIGPASQSQEMLEKLVNAGMNVARINFSHGNYEENKEIIDNVIAVREKLKKPVALMLDTKGPEIRTGKLQNETDKVKIEEGQRFSFKKDDVETTSEQSTLSYKGVFKEVKVGDTILVADGTLGFIVEEIYENELICKSLNSGMLGSRKNVNIPGVSLEQPALSDKDIDDIKKGIIAGFNFVAASFIRRADDVRQIRKLLNDNGGEKIGIISKIESQEGIDNFEEILKESDGIMVARGDMGVEIPMEEVPIVQKHFIKRCNEEGKPVITATQMLESMINNPRPTRAEVSDVANAVYDLTSAIMLSGECAMGNYPVECVEVMDKIARAIEQDISYWKRFKNMKINFDRDNLKGNSAYAIAVTAENMESDAIIGYTHTGVSAMILAGLKPDCPVIAITDDKSVYYKLGVVSNTMPILIEGEKSINDTIGAGLKLIETMQIIKKGDNIVILGGDKVLPIGKESHVIGGVMKI